MEGRPLGERVIQKKDVDETQLTKLFRRPMIKFFKKKIPMIMAFATVSSIGLTS